LIEECKLVSRPPFFFPFSGIFLGFRCLPPCPPFLSFDAKTFCLFGRVVLILFCAINVTRCPIYSFSSTLLVFEFFDMVGLLFVRHPLLCRCAKELFGRLWRLPPFFSGNLPCHFCDKFPFPPPSGCMLSTQKNFPRGSGSRCTTRLFFSMLSYQFCPRFGVFD